MELNFKGCGWCTEIGTKATKKALTTFLETNEEELEKMGRNGRELVEEKYTSIAVANEFIDMYTKLCNNND